VGSTLGCNVLKGSGKVFLAAPFELGSDRCKEVVDHAFSVFMGQCPGILKFTDTVDDVLTCTPNALAMAPKFRSECAAVAETITNLAVALDPTISGGQGAEITCLGGGAFMSFANLGECQHTVAVLNRALHYDFKNETWDGGSNDSRPRPGGDKKGEKKEGEGVPNNNNSSNSSNSSNSGEEEEGGEEEEEDAEEEDEERTCNGFKDAKTCGSDASLCKHAKDGTSTKKNCPVLCDSCINTTSTVTTTTVTTTNSSDKNLYVVQNAAYQLCHAPTTVTSTGTSTFTSTMTTTVTTHDAGELFGCDESGHFTTRFDFSISDKPEEELTTCFGHARKLNRMIGVCRSGTDGAAGKMRCDDKVIVDEEEETEEEDSKDCAEILQLFTCKDAFLDGSSVQILCPKTCNEGKDRRSLEGANVGELLRASTEDVAVLNSILRDFMHKNDSFAPLIRDGNGLLQSVAGWVKDPEACSCLTESDCDDSDLKYIIGFNPKLTCRALCGGGEDQDAYSTCATLASTLGTAMVFFEANDYQGCDWTTATSTQTTSVTSTASSTASFTATSTHTSTATFSATSTVTSTAISSQTTSATTSITSTATTTPITDMPLFKCSNFDGESLLTIEGYLKCQSTANILAGLGRLCTSLPDFTCDGLADGTFALRAQDDASCQEAVATLASASAGLKIGALGLKCNGAHVAAKSCSQSLTALAQAEAFLNPATLPTVLTWGYECACPKDTAAVYFATGAPLAALDDSQSTFETSDLLSSLGLAFDAALVPNVTTGSLSGSRFSPTSFNLTGGQVAVDVYEKLEIGQGGVCGTIKTKLQVAVSGTFEFSYGGQNLWAGTEPLKSEVPEPFTGTTTIVLALLVVGALVGLFFVSKKRTAMLILHPPEVKYSAASESVLVNTADAQGNAGNTAVDQSGIKRQRTLTNGKFVYNAEPGAGMAAADAAPQFVGETDLFGGARGMGHTLSTRRPSMKLNDFSAVTISRTDVAMAGEKEDVAPQATLAFDVGELPDVEDGGEEAPIMNIAGLPEAVPVMNNAGNTAEDLANEYLADNGDADDDDGYTASNRPTNELVNIRRAGSVKRGPADAKSPEEADKRKIWQSNFQNRMSQFST